MSITATELKLNLSKYLLLAEKEDIFITKNGYSDMVVMEDNSVLIRLGVLPIEFSGLSKSHFAKALNILGHKIGVFSLQKVGLHCLYRLIFGLYLGFEGLHLCWRKSLCLR